MNLCTYDSLSSLEISVLMLIREGKFDSALRVIQCFVDKIITEPVCTSQVFGSKLLDDLCQKIGNLNLLQIKEGFHCNVGTRRPQLVFAYIVTKLQNSGGHTRVIEDFIKARPEAMHVILSTELGGRSDTDYVLNGISSVTKLVFELAPKSDYQKKLTWLQGRLLNIRPNKVYLFNHHQDSVAIAAIQPEMEIEASFYHHGDHHLCLGVFLSYVEHIDPHPMGYHNCRKELGINNVYVPLSCEDKGLRPDFPFLNGGWLTTCTAARSNKIEIPYFVSYLDLVPKLLKKTGGRHVHIGRLTPWALYKIRRGLKILGIPGDRFIYIPWVSSVWKALHEYNVDLYIASFPYGGGLTLIEAMGAGVPVALHRHMFSRILSGIELGYCEAFSWRNPEDLLAYCAGLSTEELYKGSKLARKQFESIHTNKQLERFLNDLSYLAPEPNTDSVKFSIMADEWALWVERQISFRQLIYKGLYRAFRYLRSL